MDSNSAQHSIESRGEEKVLQASYTACSDGGFREGDSEAMATAHIVAMEVNQCLNGLLHRQHLQQGHLVISGLKK